MLIRIQTAQILEKKNLKSYNSKSYVYLHKIDNTYLVFNFLGNFLEILFLFLR